MTQTDSEAPTSSFWRQEPLVPDALVPTARRAMRARRERLRAEEAKDRLPREMRAVLVHWRNEAKLLRDMLCVGAVPLIGVPTNLSAHKNVPLQFPAGWRRSGRQRFLAATSKQLCVSYEKFAHFAYFLFPSSGTCSEHFDRTRRCNGGARRCCGWLTGSELCLALLRFPCAFFFLAVPVIIDYARAVSLLFFFCVACSDYQHFFPPYPFSFSVSCNECYYFANGSQKFSCSFECTSSQSFLQYILFSRRHRPQPLTGAQYHKVANHAGRVSTGQRTSAPLYGPRIRTRSPSLHAVLGTSSALLQ